MEDAGDDGVFVHLPFLENLLHGEGVGDVGFTGATELPRVSDGRNIDRVGDAGRIGFLVVLLLALGHL